MVCEYEEDNAIEQAHSDEEHEKEEMQEQEHLGFAVGSQTVTSPHSSQSRQMFGARQPATGLSSQLDQIKQMLGQMKISIEKVP